ncbi:hypothetical protein [Bartonella rattimassiliensis]|uniref:hypothetical protein n=1 Tax=Bartonella rattimassiliensis TaxID=270250 RepID=UPI000A95BB2C|nr:hypothetical protein [Bartonella rattimassiliensis]
MADPTMQQTPFLSRTIPTVHPNGLLPKDNQTSFPSKTRLMRQILLLPPKTIPTENTKPFQRIKTETRNAFSQDK